MMAISTRYAGRKPRAHRLPLCLWVYRWQFPFRAAKQLRQTRPDKYNADYMDADIKSIENLALARLQARRERRLMDIQRIRGLQTGELERLQAEQCMVYDSLKSVRAELAAMEAEKKKDAR